MGVGEREKRAGYYSRDAKEPGGKPKERCSGGGGEVPAAYPCRLDASDGQAATPSGRRSVGDHVVLSFQEIYSMRCFIVSVLLALTSHEMLSRQARLGWASRSQGFRFALQSLRCAPNVSRSHLRPRGYQRIVVAIGKWRTITVGT